MRELLYVPSAGFRTAGAIGILLPELANPIFPMLAQAMETRATQLGYASILCNTGGSADDEVAYVQMLLARQVDGMIFVSCEATDIRGEHGHYVRLVEDGARLVFVNGAVPTIDATSVGIDERAAGEIATRHLLELGHTRIGFVAGPAHARPTHEKLEGRDHALAAVGVPPYHELVSHAPWGVEGGARSMRQLIEVGGRRRPTAVICSSDAMAIGALREAKRAGIRVPEDMSIVGFDGIEAGEWTDPPLTTVEQPIASIGETAVETLHTLTTGTSRPLPSYIFRPQLVERGSTTSPS